MRKIILSLFIALAFSLQALAAVNINTATKAQLQTLKGIGASKAAAIVKYRTKHGKFKSVSGLKKVKGIGPKIVKKIGKNATIKGKTKIAKKAVVKKKSKKTKSQ